MPNIYLSCDPQIPLEIPFWCVIEYNLHLNGRWIILQPWLAITSRWCLNKIAGSITILGYMETELISISWAGESFLSLCWQSPRDVVSVKNISPHHHTELASGRLCGYKVFSHLKLWMSKSIEKVDCVIGIELFKVEMLHAVGLVLDASSNCIT